MGCNVIKKYKEHTQGSLFHVVSVRLRKFWKSNNSQFPIIADVVEERMKNNKRSWPTFETSKEFFFQCIGHCRTLLAKEKFDILFIVDHMGKEDKNFVIMNESAVSMLSERKDKDLPFVI